MQPIGIFGALLAVAGVVTLLINRPIADRLSSAAGRMPRPFDRGQGFFRRGVPVVAGLWIVFGLILVAIGW
jgi:hypothetical protein